MTHHPLTAEPYRGFDQTAPTVPVSRVANAAYYLEKAALALSNATTPTSKRIAQQAYDGACAEALALLEKRMTAKEAA